MPDQYEDNIGNDYAGGNKGATFKTIDDAVLYQAEKYSAEHAAQYEPGKQTVKKSVQHVKKLTANLNDNIKLIRINYRALIL